MAQMNCLCDGKFIVIFAMRLCLQKTRTLTHIPTAFRFSKCNVWAVVKAVFNKKTILFTGKLDLNGRKKLLECYIWSNALYGAETWTLREVAPKYLESFEMWCWTRTEKISWTEHVKNEEESQIVEKARNVLHKIKRRKANLIGHVVCRNSSKTRYWREDRGKDRSDWKTRKRT
jgi:hypothetical protein